MRSIAINQSNYLPWKGYFKIIKSVDVFVFLDDVQYTKNDWRNRNQLLRDGKLEWLTIPVGSCAKRLICQVILPEQNWRNSHLDKIYKTYNGSTNFESVFSFLSSIILDPDLNTLSALNQTLIKRISTEWLGIDTAFETSDKLNLESRKSQKVLDICKHFEATTYVSGPAAKSYLEIDEFKRQGVEVEWVNYDGFLAYNQASETFLNNVSIIDLLFHQGLSSAEYL